MNPKKNQSNYQLKIDPSQFRLAHLVGSDDEKFATYKDWRCPVELLQEAFEEWGKITDKSDSRANKFKEALALNPNLPAEFCHVLSQDNSEAIRGIAKVNVNHPSFHRRVLEDFHAKCLNNFLLSLKSPTLESEIRKGAILSGGAMFSLIRRNTPHVKFESEDNIKDFDFYFHNMDSLTYVVNTLLSSFKPKPDSEKFYNEIAPLKIAPNGLGVDIEQLKNGGYLIGTYGLNAQIELIITNNAITLKQKNSPWGDVQIIMTVCKPNPDDITKEFDFVHCQSYLRLDNGEVKVPAECYNSIISKKLIFKGGMNPLSAIVRMHKFQSRNWHLSRPQMYKLIAYASKTIDFTNMEQVKKLMLGFYMEKGYPEIQTMPMDKLKSLEDFMDWLDELTYKY